MYFYESIEVAGDGSKEAEYVIQSMLPNATKIYK
jgi:hypothetical protein